MIKLKIDDNEYPENLRKIKRPPKQLYLKGNIELLKKLGIAIIGSRKCTKYGEKMAIKFAKELSQYNLTIISGMAEGIDSFAHIGSIEAYGSTIAVLPSGFNNIYPEKNIELYKKIIQNGGLVISEYDEDNKAKSEQFLERNRIISGLAIGTLIIEGGYRSGTSVTAKLTKEENKYIFCIPSSLENSKGIVPNQLIKEGAFLVTEVEDIISKYPNLNLVKKKIKNSNVHIDIVNNEYKNIYDILDKEKALNINEIAKITRLDISEISYKLMMLELEDKIVSLPGNNFKIK